MQVCGKRNDVRASVKYHTAHPVFADSGCQCLQTAHLLAAQRCGGLDLDSNDSACAIFWKDVNFLPRSRAPVEKFRLSRAPCGLFTQFHKREILQNCSGQIPVCNVDDNQP